MDESKSILKKFGGVRGVVLMTIALVIGVGIHNWLNFGSGEAMQEVGAELGLESFKEGQRWQLRGRIDDIGVSVGVTTENSAGDTLWFTDFKLYAPDQPSGRIVGASFRRKAIDSVKGEQYLRTGDAAFDEAVFVEGEPGAMLPYLNKEARTAILVATKAGWELESMTWKARKSGRMTNGSEIRSLLELGLTVARATGRDTDSNTSGRNNVETEPDPVVRPGVAVVAAESDVSRKEVASESVVVTSANALQLLAEENTPQSLDAAVFLAHTGDNRAEIRKRLVRALYANERRDEVIVLLGEVGGRQEAAFLRSIKGEHEEAAKAAITSIEARL